MPASLPSDRLRDLPALRFLSMDASETTSPFKYAATAATTPLLLGKTDINQSAPQIIFFLFFFPFYEKSKNRAASLGSSQRRTGGLAAAVQVVNEQVGVKVPALDVVEAREPSDQLEEHLAVEEDRRLVVVDDVQVDPPAGGDARRVLDDFLDKRSRCKSTSQEPGDSNSAHQVNHYLSQRKSKSILIIVIIIPITIWRRCCADLSRGGGKPPQLPGLVCILKSSLISTDRTGASLQSVCDITSPDELSMVAFMRI